MSDKVKTVLGIAVPLVLVLALIVVSVWGVQQPGPIHTKIQPNPCTDGPLLNLQTIFLI